MTRLSKAKAIERLQKSRAEMSALRGLATGSPEFDKWHRNAIVAIQNTFGERSDHVKDFTNVGYSPMIATSRTPASYYQETYLRGLGSAESILTSMIEEIQEYWENETLPTNVNDSPPPGPSEPSTRVFIIHGRDSESKEILARFFTKLGLDPVILHEQLNQGQTIIEKFERHAHVGFAIALLTPDDLGALAGDNPGFSPRARQNVVFEMGYFLGALGRHNVCALVKGDIELPSDYAGVSYITLDTAGAWKLTLVRELKGAGLNVDANLAV